MPDSDETEPIGIEGVSGQRLELALEVLAEIERLPVDHPDAVRVRLATAGLYKSVKLRRRKARIAAEAAADATVTSATATGAPGRIDDETGAAPRAFPTPTPRGRVGVLARARSCYTCKARYVDVDAFYHQLCPDCATLNRARRDARTDLVGRRALLTGGRAKIGMHIALRLLRDGAHTTITTRFPADAARRFASIEDSGEWLERLRIVGIDLRDPAQVISLADTVAAHGPLDILINNATQTVRRSPGAYSHLMAAEVLPLPPGPMPELVDIGHTVGAVPQGIAGISTQLETMTPDALAGLGLVTEAASLERLVAGTAIDAGGLIPDTDEINSWTRRVHEVDPVELLEVQLCNLVAPFLLVSRLRPSMASSSARRKYVVNVSAMEGQFSRAYKGPGHPHTNMAKAGMNMLTRTSAEEMLTDGILMTSVDTGWITDERPHPTKVRLAQEGFQAPLDLSDGAARVYDPIVRGELGEDIFGCFLKDYRPSPW